MSDPHKRTATSLMLRHALAASPTTHGKKIMIEKIEPLAWEAFGPEAIPQLEEHTAKAAHDVWWTWPEAIAWVGSEDYRKIATLRQWGDLWEGEAGDALKGQEDIARDFCTSHQQAEARLMQAIETGAIQTSGRSKPNASPMRLEPETWRGGTITFSHGTACLVSKLDTWSTPWAYDVAVKRADLVALTVNGQADAAALKATDGSVRSTANGEHECKNWLLAAFVQDDEMKRSKDSFRNEAIERSSGRLSVRGFNRVWDAVAPKSGRSKPGRKRRKS